jgi:hypothetical protein
LFLRQPPIEISTASTRILHFSSSSSSLPNNEAIPTLPYGLRRIDYSKLSFDTVPPMWSLPPNPPPHPSQSVVTTWIQRYLAPLLMATVVAGGAYLTLYPDHEMYDYWRQVEQGNVPLDDDDDDYDDDDDE